MKKIQNKSGLRPCGVAVLLEPYEVKKGVLVIPETVADRQRMIETRAVVIAIGSEAWKDESQPRAKIGDRVMISRFAGLLVEGPADGKTYRMCNDRDIHTVIETERENV